MGQSGDDGASRSAAACLAEIAVLEIPHRRWPTFAQEMQRLVATEEKNDACVALRKNAVTLIGQVCGQLDPSRFSQPEVDALVASLRAGMTSRSPGVIAASVDALTSSMKFMEANLGVKAQRDSLIADLVQKGVKSLDALVQEKALQCMVALCDDYYRCVASRGLCGARCVLCVLPCVACGCTCVCAGVVCHACECACKRASERCCERAARITIRRGVNQHCGSVVVAPGTWRST